MTPPPTSIDGTNITGATIDGQEVQEITIDGETVFTAGPNPADFFDIFYAMDEGSGASLTDTNSFTDASWNGSWVSSTEGFNGSHLEFDGNGDFFVSNDTSSPIGSTFAFGGWIYPFDFDRSSPLVMGSSAAFQGGDLEDNSHFEVQPGGDVRVWGWNSNQGGVEWTFGQNVLTTNKWYYVAVNLQNGGEDGDIRIYDSNINIVYSDSGTNGLSMDVESLPVSGGESADGVLDFEGYVDAAGFLTNGNISFSDFEIIANETLAGK